MHMAMCGAWYGGREGISALTAMGRVGWIAVLAGACTVGNPANDGFATGPATTLAPTGTGDDPGDDDDDTTTGTGDDPGDDDDDSGDASSDGDDGSTGEPLPPFACTVDALPSPVLAGQVIFDPADPHPGDTVTVIVRATNGLSRTDAPPMTLEVEHGGGAPQLAPQTIEGGDALYYYAVPDVGLGDLCVTGVIDGAPEVAAKVTVTPRLAGPGGDVYKITANHMWTCDEQPNNGNELHVYVRDENGQPLEGVTVDVALADATDPGSIYNGDAEALPGSLVTGADGHANTFNYWPISDHGLLVFNVSVADGPSDIATEITTGWWEDDLMGCSYCGTPTVNVWGHWSYTVEFQRTPDANEVCVVPNDHAGMSACGEPRHIHHDPNATWCWTP